MAIDKVKMLEFAYEYAAKRSTDNRTQNAALLLGEDGEILVAEANRFPGYLDHNWDRLMKPQKKYFMEHAERNAIYTAARMGVRTAWLTMVCPWAPCADCARAIIAAGIGHLIVHDAEMHREQEEWRETVAYGDRMLEEAGIPVSRVKAEFPTEILFNGKLRRPS